MNTRILLATTLALSLAASASVGASGKKNLDYASYAGPAVPEISYSNLYNWQRTGDKTVAVWTKPSTAYLLTLKNSCDALNGRVQVQFGGVDDIGGKLRAGTDDVRVGGIRCRITQIQPIDLEKMKADRRA